MLFVIIMTMNLPDPILQEWSQMILHDIFIDISTHYIKFELLDNFPVHFES